MQAWFQQDCAGGAFACGLRMQPLQRIVYVLKNGDQPPHYYTGVTADLGARLRAHNAGRCPHTAKHRPWRVDAMITFSDAARALRLEKYLKSGSGVAFARRHLR